jgi:DNA-binding IclR family transcriptional regulator
LTHDPDFPEALRAFIRDHIADVDAAELLLQLAREPGRQYDVASLLAALNPTAISEGTARRHLTLFEERGLVYSEAAGLYRYSPDTPEVADCVQALMRVYNARPVTMVRMIYALRDEKIRSFADAFRIKKK